MIDAQNGKTIEGQVLHERVIGAADGGKILIMVHMLWIHVRHNGDRGGQFGETAVGFIGFNDHPFAFA